ncbi:hypothetical protein GmHk_19G054827 [Glycine max]|nr:hypothetical protein GmHk_19G054827 [Glycine max]
MLTSSSCLSQTGLRFCDCNHIVEFAFVEFVSALPSKDQVWNKASSMTFSGVNGWFLNILAFLWYQMEKDRASHRNSHLLLSMTLRGLGPQSMILDLKRMGQWSEKSLSNTNCVVSGQRDSHSSDRRNLSSLLITVPLGLHQVKHLPTDLTSSTSMSAIHELNSEILVELPTDWDELNLS